MLSQCFQNNSKVFNVVLAGFAVNQDVVQVNNDELVKVLMKHIIHQRHECGWCICETKTQDQKFVMAVACAKCCLGNVFVFNANLMVTGIQINLGKVLGTDKSIHEFIDAGQRVPVLYGNFVQGTIIDTKPEGT